MTLEEVVKAAKDDTRFRVESYRGVAFYFHSPEKDYRYDYDEEMETFPTGMANMVMVGDDRIHVIDPDEISPLRDDEYCSSCGQIGCGHGG